MSTCATKSCFETPPKLRKLPTLGKLSHLETPPLVRRDSVKTIPDKHAEYSFPSYE